MKKRIAFLTALTMASALISPGFGQDSHIRSAQEFMRSGQWDYASYEWRAALERSPNNVDAHAGLARALLNGGFSGEAVRHLQSIPKSVRNLDLLLLLAQAYEEEGDHEKPMHLYLEVLRKYPANPVAFQHLKKLSRKLPEQRRNEIASRLTLESQQARARGDALFEAGRYNEAADYYQLVINHTRAFKDINDYGLSLLMAGRKKEAANMFGLIENKTGDWRILSNAALAQLSIGQPYHARLLIQKALASCDKPEDKAYLYNHLGYVYEISKKYTQARFSYEKAIELKADYRKARMNQAYIYRKDGLYNQALAVYKGLLKQEPENAELWNFAGYAHEMQRQNTDALRAYRKAIALKPDLKEAHFNLAMLYKKLGKKDKATETMKQVMEIEFREAELAAGKAKPVITSNLTDYVEIFPIRPVPAHVVKTAPKTPLQAASR